MEIVNATDQDVEYVIRPADIDILFSRERAAGLPWEDGEALSMALGGEVFLGRVTKTIGGVLAEAVFPAFEAPGCTVDYRATFVSAASVDLPMTTAEDGAYCRGVWYADKRDAEAAERFAAEEAAALEEATEHHRRAALALDSRANEEPAP